MSVKLPARPMEIGNQAIAAASAATEEYRTIVRARLSPIATQADKHSAAAATTFPTGSPPNKDASKKLPPKISVAIDPIQSTTSMGTLRSNSDAMAAGKDWIDLIMRVQGNVRRRSQFTSGHISFLLYRAHMVPWEAESGHLIRLCFSVRCRAAFAPTTPASRPSPLPGAPARRFVNRLPPAACPARGATRRSVCG